VCPIFINYLDMLLIYDTRVNYAAADGETQTKDYG